YDSPRYNCELDDSAADQDRNSYDNGEQLHSHQGVMNSIPVRTEGEDLLDGAIPSFLHLAIPALALALDIAFISAEFSSNTVWYVIRASGVVAYVLLTLSVISGLLIT